MKIILKHKAKVLKEIDLSDLQLKAIRLTGQKPEDYFSRQIERILNSAVNQAKQMIDRVSPLSDAEIEDILDELGEE